jgi:hypothetical protein
MIVTSSRIVEMTGPKIKENQDLLLKLYGVPYRALHLRQFSVVVPSLSMHPRHTVFGKLSDSSTGSGTLLHSFSRNLSLIPSNNCVI